MTDDILAGVRQAREELLASHSGDLRALVAELRELDAKGDWPVVSLPPRRPIALCISKEQAVPGDAVGVSNRPTIDPYSIS
jgi:hypothetical protein